MSKATDELEAAFPGTFNGWEREGMTLRDWFAGQILHTAALTYEPGAGNAELVARAAYQYADAMLAEREKRKLGAA